MKGNFEQQDSRIKQIQSSAKELQHDEGYESDFINIVSKLYHFFIKQVVCIKQFSAKKATIVVLFLVLGLLFSCNQIDKLTHFYLTYNESFSVAPIPGVTLPSGSDLPDTETSFNATHSLTFQANDLIESIKLDQIYLKIDSSAQSDLSFLKSIEVYIATDNLEEIRMAWNESVPLDCGDSLVLEHADSDLKAYLLCDSFKLRINTVVRKVYPTDQSIMVCNRFFVDAQILGI